MNGRSDLDRPRDTANEVQTTTATYLAFAPFDDQTMFARYYVGGGRAMGGRPMRGGRRLPKKVWRQLLYGRLTQRLGVSTNAGHHSLLPLISLSGHLKLKTNETQRACHELSADGIPLMSFFFHPHVAETEARENQGEGQKAAIAASRKLHEAAGWDFLLLQFR